MSINEAIAKLRSEMDQNPNDAYIRIIGKFLIQHVTTNPDQAGKILAPDKNVKKSLDSMRTEARKKQVGGCAMLTDAEGFAIVLKYFGIEPGAVPISAAPAAPSVPATPKPAFDVRLEDFL
jgi:hypothetical protein